MASQDLFAFYKRKKPESREGTDSGNDGNRDRSQPSTSTSSTKTGPSSTSSTSTSSDRGTGSHAASATSSGTEPPAKKSKKVDKFQTRWLEQWSWLRYEDQDGPDGGMFCASCKEARPAETANFVGKGSRDFKTSALRRHATSKIHSRSLEAIKARKIKPLEKHAMKVAEEKEQGVLSALKTTYFMAQRHIANHLHSDLMDFLRFQNSPEAALLSEGVYSHHSSQDEMREAICGVIEEGIKEKLISSDFVGVIIDESTDIAVAKTLIVYMTLVNHGKRETHFIKNVEIEGGTAEVVAAKVREVCRDMGVGPMKVMGFGSDGASVMMGSRGGVVAKLKEANPDLIGIHCVAHRLALVTSQASRGVRYLQDYEKKLAALFTYFHNSPARMKTLKEIETLLNEDNLRIAGLHFVRWLSMKNAVTTVHRIYSSILLALEHDSGNPTAKGLHTFFAKSSALLVTSYLRDVLGSIGILSKTFQRDNLTLTTVTPMVDSTRCQIRSMLHTPAEFERGTRSALTREETEQEDGDQVEYKGAAITHTPAMVAQVDALKASFTENLLKNLEDRFPSGDLSVTSSFQVLDPANMGMLPAASAQLIDYGTSEMAILTDHYSAVLPDSEACAKEEFPLFKRLIVDNYLGHTFEQMAERVLTDLDEEFPNIATLYRLSLILPVSSAACERGFSIQNVIKDCHRNRLSTQSVNRLTCISLEGPPYHQFDYARAYLKWKAMKERR